MSVTPMKLTALVPCVLAVAPVSAAQETGALANYLPRRTAFVLEAPGLTQLFEQGIEAPWIERVLASEVGAQLLANSPLEPDAAVAIADAYAGFPVLARAAALTRAGALLGVEPRRAGPTWMLALRGDAELWAATLELALTRFAPLLDIEVGEGGVQEHERIGTARVWNLSDKLSVALNAGDFLAAASRADLVEMLASYADAQESIGARADYRRACERGAPGFARLWIDLERLEQRGAPDELRQMISKPGVQFLLGSIPASIGTAKHVSAALSIDTQGLGLRITGFDANATARELMPQPAAVGPPPFVLDATDGGVAAVYRDLAGLFEQRADLFPAGVQPAFAEALSTLALFFGGADVSEEILPHLSPWIGLTLADAEFAAAAQPEVVLPAVALHVRLDDPERIGARLVGAFQTAIGIINVDGAQKMQPPLVLSMSLEGEVPLTSARFPDPESETGVDLRYNFVPACAVVGDQFVLGSHISLVRRVVQRLANGGPSDAPESTGEYLRIDTTTVARAISRNLDALVMNAVLNEGKERAQALLEFAFLRGVLGLLSEVRISTARTVDEVLALELHALWVTEDEE